jgi:hypothetical protein
VGVVQDPGDRGIRIFLSVSITLFLRRTADAGPPLPFGFAAGDDLDQLLYLLENGSVLALKRMAFLRNNWTVLSSPDLSGSQAIKLMTVLLNGCASEVCRPSCTAQSLCRAQVARPGHPCPMFRGCTCLNPSTSPLFDPLICFSPWLESWRPSAQRVAQTPLNRT